MSRQRTLPVATSPEPPRRRQQAVELSSNEVSVIDEYLAVEKALEKFRPLKRKRDKLREQVNQIFAGREVAVLEMASRDDSRMFIRLVDTRDYDPLPAKTVEIARVKEILPWDV